MLLLLAFRGQRHPDLCEFSLLYPVSSSAAVRPCVKGEEMKDLRNGVANLNKRDGEWERKQCVR